MSNGTTEIQEVVAERAGMPTPMELQLDSQKAIARIESISKIIEGCVKVSCLRTNPKDWVWMKHKQKQSDGSYKTVESFYLQATGAEKIRAVWGIRLFDKNVFQQNNPDGTYAFLVTGKVSCSLLDRFYGEEVVMETEGSRSSGDPFFSKNERAPDPMDVRKAAVANWEARSITSILGLKNFTATDLTKNGIDIKEIAGFDFQKGAEGGGQTALVSDAQRKRLYAICRANKVTETMVKIYLNEHYKLDSTAKILRSDYEAICNWAESGGLETDQREPRQEG